MARRVGAYARLTVAVTVFSGTVLVMSCSDGARPAPYDGTSQTGFPPVVDARADSPREGGGEGGSSGTSSGSVDASLCASRAQLCTPFSTPGGTAPGPINGGTLVEGTYVLVGSTGTTLCRTLYIGNGFLHEVRETVPGVDGGPGTNEVLSSSFTATGSAIDVIIECPNPARIGVGYGFDGTKLSLQFPSGLGDRTDVYLKQ